MRILLEDEIRFYEIFVMQVIVGDDVWGEIR